MSGTNGALHDAVENGDLDKVIRLLSKGDDINAQGKYNRTPLHFAAKTGHVGIAEYLLQSDNIKPCSKNAHGFTPVYVAAVANNIDVLRVLLSHPGIEIDATDLGGMSPLIAATCNGCSVEVISLLLEAGASPSLEDSIGRRALDWAREKKFDHIYKLLCRCEL